MSDVEEEELVARVERREGEVLLAVAVGGDHVVHLDFVGAGDLEGVRMGVSGVENGGER